MGAALVWLVEDGIHGRIVGVSGQHICRGNPQCDYGHANAARIGSAVRANGACVLWRGRHI